MSSCRFWLAFSLLIFGSHVPESHAQLSKGHQILIDRGFQLQGMIQPHNLYHLDTYTNAGYTTVAFGFDSTGNLGPISTFTGDPPGLPWARWAPDETNMPGMGIGFLPSEPPEPPIPYSRTNEIPHLSQLVAVQLGDEWNLDNPQVRTNLVNWFDAVRANWPNTILYHNNWGYQMTNEAHLADYINRAKPDMLSFDTYPWQSVYDTSQPNSIGATIPGPGSYQLYEWYRALRQNREYARAAGIPMAIWRQTWHGVQSWDAHVYRDPSPSELRLNTFAAIAFSAKFINDFVYNGGANSLFTNSLNGVYVGYAGDTTPHTNGLYAELKDVNQRVRNWGNTLVRLTPITTEGIPGYTTSVMFIRGKDANGNLSQIPDGFVGDVDTGGNSASYTDWVYQRNDPYLTNNWVVTNKGTKNNGHPGDVVISWFKPLDESFDGPDHTNETYMMVVNGLTDPTGSAADCLQEIKLNFHSSLAAVEMLNPATGVTELQLLPLTNGLRQLVLNLNGGDAALFKFSDGAPFISAPMTPVAGAPLITIHPASRANVLGANAAFTVRAAGSATLSYQWQFNGADLAGATTNAYARTNVQLADAGTYTVIVSNSFGAVTSTPAALTIISSQPFFYEPFDYPNIGSPVSSNTPPNWTYGGTGTNDLNITSGSLSYPGLQSPIGNSVTNGGVGLGVRRLLGTSINSGTLYFSALFRINDLGYGTWTAAGTATQVGALMANDNSTARLAVMIKSNSPTGFIIGVQKGGTGVTPTFDTTTEHYTNETIFLLGKYDFTTIPNSVSLWINPSSSTFGSASTPTSGFISATTGTDGLTIDRFNMRQNTAVSVPASMQWDELRVGNSWAEATPIPITFITGLAGFVRLGDGRFQFTYTNITGSNGSIYASTNLIDWNSIGSGSQISPGLFQFIDSNATNYPRRFYQLRSP